VTALAETHDFPIVIAVGASAGGVEALTRLVGLLPADLGAPVLVVLHVSPTGTSVLPEILDRRTKLVVRAAGDGEALHAGRIYVAPSDVHLAVEDGVVRVTREPRENGHRPAVDPLLRSVARAYGHRSVGVVLSGSRDDGARGLAILRAAGGTALVQDPGECLYAGMPTSALNAVPDAEVLGVEALAARLIELAQRPPEPGRLGATTLVAERTATRFTCPDCGGVLFEEHSLGAEAYSCSVGHSYSPESLSEEQARHLESALWAAVRSLEDRAVLLRRLRDRARRRGHTGAGAAFERQADDATDRANTIRAVIAEPIRHHQPDAA
jgi:two-component system chemotaxis response regulator CheB